VNHLINTSINLLILLAITAVMGRAGYAHLPAYEGERVRNDNHFTEEGFAWPVRGECDINAVGPTDIDAGSANLFLGPGNIPPNFFCAFTAQDDWSFEFPLDIIESTRTPAPDPEFRSWRLRICGHPFETMGTLFGPRSTPSLLIKRLGISKIYGLFIP